MASPRTLVEMAFADGFVLSNWTQFSVRSNFTEPVEDLHFVVRPTTKVRTEAYDARIQKGEQVEVKFNGVSQGQFLIQTVNVRIGRDGITYTLQCGNLLITPGQATVDPDISKHYETDAPVSTVVLEALSPYGFSTLEGDDTANRRSLTGKDIGSGKAPITVDALKHSDAQAQDNERAYDFCQRFFRRYGAALRLDVSGKLLLSAPDYNQDPLYTLTQDFDGSTTGNRMLDPIDITDTNDDQFSECRVRGAAGDPAGNTFSATPEATVTSSQLNPSRPPYKSGAALFKPLYLKDKHARDKARCLSVAKLALGLRAARSFQIRCEVDGFVSREGALYQINTVAQVIIKARSISEPFWVLEREFVQDRDGGQKTRLTLIPIGALVLGDLPS